MKFLMFIKHSESFRSQPIPQGLQDAMGEFVNEGFTKGWLKDTGGLKPSEHGFRLRLRGGKLNITDGPFTESKEVISEEEAREISRRFMELHRIHWPTFEAESEVRPLEDY
jgi:hypothetical protein